MWYRYIVVIVIAVAEFLVIVIVVVTVTVLDVSHYIISHCTITNYCTVVAVLYRNSD